MIFQLLYVVCCLCLYWMVTVKKRKTVLLPPYLPRKLPLLGHAHLLLGDTIYLKTIFDWVGRETVKLGGVAILAVGPKVGYAIADPDDCLTAANACLDKEYVYGFAVPWLGEGLVWGNVQVWKKHRRLINPGFTQNMLNGFIKVFNDQSRQLVQQWTSRTGPFKHDRDISLNNLETICLTTTGCKMDDGCSTLNEDYENAMTEMLNILTERFQKIWLHFDFIYKWSKLKQKQDRLLKVLKDMTLILQTRKIEKANFGNVGPQNQDNFKSFIDVMSEVAHSNAKLYTYKDVIQDVDNIIFAGHDTISTSMTIILAVLGSYTTVQEKAYKEIQELFGDSDRDVEKVDLSKLIYLEAIIKETLRIHPLAMAIARYAREDLKLRNYTIKAGSPCYLLFSALHQHPIWGPDADQFRPERWLDGSLPTNSSAYAAFSLGRRSCVGKSYAISSLKISLTHILRRYRVSSDVTKLVFKLETLLKLASGFEISLESRY